MKCSHCEYFYKYNPQDSKGGRRAKQILNGHMNDEHGQVKLKCDECDKTFWTVKQLNNHRANHSYLTVDGHYSCDQCDYKCKKTNRLRFHIDSVAPPDSWNQKILFSQGVAGGNGAVQFSKIL